MTIDTSREAVERLLNRMDSRSGQTRYECKVAIGEIYLAILARAEAAEAREQALLTSYDEERRALVENASLRERLKASEAERHAQARRITMQRKELRNLQDWFPAHEKLRWQYLEAIAERDAALAEVARLSAPPDDAEVAKLVAAYRSCAKSLEHEPGFVAKELRRHHEATADALTRLSHALAAETAKREAMEEALRMWESYGCPDCGGDCASANPPVVGCIMQLTAATLAKHGSKT